MKNNKESNKLVVKHNKLVEFKGRMSVNELKLFCLIVADIEEEQESQFREYNIDISILQEATKNKNFYDYIKDVALKLESKRIVVEEKNSRNFNTIRLINKPRYEEGSKDLTIDIDKDLIPYVLNLKKHFTAYEISNILYLNSSYSIRLYELLKQEEYRGSREISIKKLRAYFDIGEEEYKAFKDFERRTLKVAKEEINRDTDLKIDYEKKKTGRRITSILFKIESKDQERKVYLEYLDKEYDIKTMKMKMGILKENFNSEQVIDLYSLAVEKMQDKEEKEIFDYIKLNYRYVIEKNINKNGRYGYLMKALQEDYAIAKGQISVDYYIEKES